MAIATERWSDKQLSKSSSQWTATRTFDVVGATTNTEAAEAPGVAIGNSHPESSLLVCTDVSARANGLGIYITTATYASSAVSGGGNSGDPLLQPAIVRWGKIVSSDYFDRDINGNPLVNSVGDPNSGGFPRLTFSRQLTIIRNEPFYDTVKADNIQGFVCSDSFTFKDSAKSQGFTYPAGSVMCTGMIQAGEFAITAEYVPIQYDFEVRLPNSTLTTLQKRHPFQLRFLDVGTRGYAGTVLDAFYNGSTPAKKIDDAMRLNGRGVPLDTAIKIGSAKASPTTQALRVGAIIDAEKQNGTSGGVYLIYMQYPERTFAGMI